MLQAGISCHLRRPLRPFHGAAAHLLRPSLLAHSLQSLRRCHRYRACSRRCLRACSQQGASQALQNVPLLLGDAIMLAATDMASNRIPVHQSPLTALVLLVSWVAMAAMRGDYRRLSVDAYDPFSTPLTMSVGAAVARSAFTWALFAPAALAAFAVLYQHSLLEGDWVAGLHHHSSGDISNPTPPEVELVAAALWTVSSWRGIYSLLQSWSQLY